MKHTFIIFIFSFFFVGSTQCQKILETNSGQRILLVEDGSWRILNKTELSGSKDEELGTSLDVFKSPKQGKYPINPDQREKVVSLLTSIRSDEAQLLVNIEMANRKLHQVKSERKLAKKAKNDTKKLESQIADINFEIKNSENYYRIASNLIDVSSELLDGSIKNPEDVLQHLLTEINSFDPVNTGMGGLDTKQSENSTPDVSVENKSLKYPTVFKLSEQRNAKENYECKIVFNGYDDKIGENRKEVKTQSFFSYSQEKMKPYFKSENFLTCDANLSKVGKKYYLTLKIRIRSKDASKTYGVLRSNENIKIELINGRKIYGKSINKDKGTIESYTGHTLYTGIYELDNSDIKDLKNNYLDNIGVIWSSGYEEYDIYNVDFLINQIECLTK
ncbi:MAG: hypothetical protein P1U56_09360 [Saprospiraceae bacterium]|nr:hypothetical protein [Saprospiraceae bacterium]